MLFSGSPFLFHVDAVNSGYVTAYGPGLSHGVVHEPAYFTINTKEAGAGGQQCWTSYVMIIKIVFREISKALKVLNEHNIHNVH